jgi:hypothetical protein
MNMKSAFSGKRTSEAEVTNITKNGLWLLIDQSEHFLPFDQFPWFQNAPIDKVLHVAMPSPHHLYWPELDVDLAVESIEHPEKFPLLSRAPRNAKAAPKRKTAPRPRQVGSSARRKK